jgi:hypothetical protein
MDLSLQEPHKIVDRRKTALVFRIEADSEPIFKRDQERQALDRIEVLGEFTYWKRSIPLEFALHNGREGLSNLVFLHAPP